MSDPAPAKWSELWRRLDGSSAAGPLFDDLARRYAEPHRAYHNLAHVLDCLEEFAPVRRLAREPDAVELALWYHDAVYDPRAKDNEEQSAELAKKVLVGASVTENFHSKVINLILATKSHDSTGDADAPLVVDVDLSILGKPAKRFDEYELQIRREYDWVSDEAFAQGRAAILEKFLARPELYRTAHFREKYERQARENLRRSIDRLRAARV